MKQPSYNDPANLSSALVSHIDKICDRFEDAWKTETRPRMEEFLSEVDGPANGVLFRQLLLLELDYLDRDGHQVQQEQYAVRFPEYLEEIAEVFAHRRPEDSLDESTPAQDRLGLEDTTPLCLPTESTEKKAGRYIIQKKLGQGSFGEVYLALDELLDRQVALKVLRKELFTTQGQTNRYLEEVRSGRAAPSWYRLGLRRWPH